ncbi:putative nuclease HARBI1 [Photinus pyralis]|uniref:putative nuclease HARBI1 n=1 Tax=Photinus pyralis TaxID=7054 RepID=UPI0012677BEF|nr:putative nuclease HARBI1 [Photinus pyralis]
MEVEDEIILDDDHDFLEIIEFGFPRKFYQRPNFLEEMDDLNFLKRFRLTKQATMSVLELIENQLEFENDLNNSVSPINQLLTTLLFYASSSHQINVGDYMCMNQSTVSRIVKKVSQQIAALRNQFIQMPTTPEEIISTQNKFYRVARFPRVIGCLDGTHVKIRSPGGEDSEVYRNRKSYFSINVQLVCDSDLKISNIVARWPGSAHDATIFNNSRLKTLFEAGHFRSAIMLGDSGYGLKQYLLTPLLNPITRPQQLYNESHIRTRNCIERTNGVWKRRFPVLCYGLRCEMETGLTIIVATAVLHNIAINMRDDVPPPPNDINAEELDYLIAQGQIPVINVNENINYDFRTDLINNHFANL